MAFPVPRYPFSFVSLAQGRSCYPLLPPALLATPLHPTAIAAPCGRSPRLIFRASSYAPHPPIPRREEPRPRTRRAEVSFFRPSPHLPWCSFSRSCPNTCHATPPTTKGGGTHPTDSIRFSMISRTRCSIDFLFPHLRTLFTTLNVTSSYHTRSVYLTLPTYPPARAFAEASVQESAQSLLWTSSPLGPCAARDLRLRPPPPLLLFGEHTRPLRRPLAHARIPDTTIDSAHHMYPLPFSFSFYAAL